MVKGIFLRDRHRRTNGNSDMTDRLDTQEDPLAVMLRDLEQAIADIKNKQFNGTDTIQSYQNTNVGWDIDWTLASATGRDFSIIFEADNQDAAVNDLTYEILIDDTYHYRVASFDTPQHDHDAAVLGWVHDSFLSYAVEEPAPKKDGWYFNITGYRVGMNIKVKFTCHSTDTGEIRVTEI